MLLCFALTVWTMGYSALPGFGLLALLYPLQSFMMGRLLRLRRGSMPFTDARVKAVVEAVAAIRLVKTNAYEESLLSKIGKLRLCISAKECFSEPSTLRSLTRRRLLLQSSALFATERLARMAWMQALCFLALHISCC
ncbi:hypothetical protein LB505_011683 [Fusarium chuoi]|nr:hypothetical protein LB505_011683 [Fusarium chuoi]